MRADECIKRSDEANFFTNIINKIDTGKIETC